MSLQNNAFELLLKEAKEQEKKYKWLQASEFYGKAVDLAYECKSNMDVAECEERIGFCFYRAAFQAKTNVEFKRLLKRAIQAYERETEVLEKAKGKNIQAKIAHAHALVAYTGSWLETKLSKKKQLSFECWSLEKQALKGYEASGDSYSAGKICNNLIEWSLYNRHFLTNLSEENQIFKEAIGFAEKAIQIFSKLNEIYELARAYCFVSWYYGGSNMFIEDENAVIQFAKKCQDYLNKALGFSKKIGDAWLISKSYESAWNAAQLSKLDPFSAMKIAENMLKYGKIAKDNYLIGIGNQRTSYSANFVAMQLEDPDKQREELRKAIKLAQEAKNNFQIINLTVGLANSCFAHSLALNFLASIETDPKTRQELLEMTGKVIQEGIERTKGTGLYFNLSHNLSMLSETKTDLAEKRDLLQKARYYLTKSWTKSEDGKNKPNVLAGYFQLSHVQSLLANTETDNTKKLELLNEAVSSIEKYIKPMEKKKRIYTQSAFGRSFHFGSGYTRFGEILQQIYSLTKEEKSLCRAIEAYKKAIAFYESADLPSHVAELCWRVAQLFDLQGERQKASQNYKHAAEAYDLASKKIPQLKQFYNNYSAYMRAWSQIEQARYTHFIEDYDKAKVHYEKSAELHDSSEFWSYLAPNYSAWASVEEAEGLSRKENSQLAKTVFKKALELFNEAEKSVKQKVGEITSAEEKEMVLRLSEASDLRRKYCQVRILMEDAKLLDREGKYLESSHNYGEAAENISAIVDRVDVEAERKELRYLAILCEAWQKMADAEETTSSESYLEAAALFENAKEHCYTKKASLWALGNSNFCRGLAAGAKYQTMLDVEDHNKAKGYIQNAATNYFKAGYRNASEYAKATLRLFDAYLFMNQAERESDTEKRVKQYQLAENLLQLASDSFMEAQQPEKTAQVKQILENVREEKELAISFNKVLQAPSVASTTQSFAAPTPTSETSVGLEQFQHANIQANLITHAKQVKVGESFCLSVEFVNAGKEPALLMRVEDFVPPDFIVVKKPEIYRLEDSCLNMKGKQIAPLKLVEAKLVFQPFKKGVYQLKPTVHYLDELGQNKSLQLKSVAIKVEEVILSDRVSTGTKELDSVLLGGIPNEYAVVITGPPSDEREMLIKNFLKAGAKDGQTSFYITTEAAGLESLLKKHSFYLFLCNPKPNVKVPDLPNVYRLRGKTDLNNLNMAIMKAYRNVEPSSQKRVCIGIVSDVLVDYEVKATRKWIAELTTDLVSRGFTVLAVINTAMHPSDQAAAVLDLFDGEISITQAEDPSECKKSVIVKKLRNQDFIKNSICLTRQK